jgi:hypothetical protein
MIMAINIYFSQGLLPKNSEYSIAPNPVNEKLFIHNHSDAESPLQIEIIDAQGSKVHYVNDAMGELGLDVSMLNNGLYIIHITCKKETTYHRFIKN